MVLQEYRELAKDESARRKKVAGAFLDRLKRNRDRVRAAADEVVVLTPEAVPTLTDNTTWCLDRIRRLIDNHVVTAR